MMENYAIVRLRWSIKSNKFFREFSANLMQFLSSAIFIFIRELSSDFQKIKSLNKKSRLIDLKIMLNYWN